MANFEKYEVLGRKLDRVTSILGVINKPALVGWYGKYGTPHCKKVLSESAEFGTQLHAYIEHYNRQGRDPPDMPNTRHQTLFAKYKAWAIDNNVECLDYELQVHSMKWGYAGTLDSLVRVNGKLEIHDYKTSKDMYETYQLQLMAYVIAMKEMGLWVNEHVGRRVIRLGRENNDMDVCEFTDDKADYKAWISAIRLYRWNKATKEFLTNRSKQAA